MEKLLIVDGNSLLHRGFHASEKTMQPNSEGIYVNAVNAFDNMLRKAIQIIKPEYVIVCFDKGKSSFRYSLYQEYKSNRKEINSELVPQFELVRKYLDSYNIKWIDSDEYEADDLIGSISRKFFVENCILTSDHDLLQLVDFISNVYLIKHGLSEYEIIDEEKFDEMYDGLKPEQLVDLKSLIGDKSDNIPGVKGVGKVNAYKLLHSFRDCENIYRNIENISGKTKEYLKNNESECKLSKELAKIKLDIPISFELKDLKLNLREKNRYAFCKKYELF